MYKAGNYFFVKIKNKKIPMPLLINLKFGNLNHPKLILRYELNSRAFFIHCLYQKIMVLKNLENLHWSLSICVRRKIRMKWMLRFFMLLLSVLSSSVSAESICKHVDMDWLCRQAAFPPEAKIIYKKDLGALCEVVLTLDGNLVPLYSGADFLLVGKLFKNKKIITHETLDALQDVAREEQRKADEKMILEAEKRKAFFKQNLGVLNDLTLFSFKPGSAGEFLYIITDPNCSHCKQLMSELEMVAMEKHLEIKVILYPFLDTESRDMAAQAICKKYSYEAYKQIVFQPDTRGCAQANVFLEKTMTFFSKADLSFVPVVISGVGAWVVEGNNIFQVKQHLGMIFDKDLKEVDVFHSESSR